MPEEFVPKTEPQEEHKEEYLSPKIGEAGEIKTLLEWHGPARPYRAKSRSYYITIALLVVVLGLIAFLASEFLLIGVLLALAFVAYVLAYVEPGNVKYRISTQGVTIGNHFYFWHEMDSFWFKEKDGHKVLYIQTLMSFPGQLMLVLEEGKEEEVKREVARFLPFHEIPRTTFMDRWSDRLQKYIPLETHH